MAVARPLIPRSKTSPVHLYRPVSYLYNIYAVAGESDVRAPACGIDACHERTVPGGTEPTKHPSANK